jgi:hypothetical protein
MSQVCRAETSAGMWLRNGFTLPHQSYLYMQSHLSTSFFDVDLALIRIVAANVNPEWFMHSIIASFYLHECLQIAVDRKAIRDPTWTEPLLEASLR